ncbi:MAG: LTA synthase family protein [Caryophanon sp.]|nr:LTA synthase family protein [Caryophanon sp.]
MKTYAILLIAIIAVWVKTVAIHLLSFDLGIETFTQQLILWLSPLSFLCIVFGFAFLFRKAKARNLYILATIFVLDLILYGNVGFYRFYTDFVTIPVLSQTSNFGDLGGSIKEILAWSDVLFFIDFFIVLVAVKMMKEQEDTLTHRKRFMLASMAVAGLIFAANLFFAEQERPDLLTRSFDRLILVKNLGIYNYHLYDAYTQTKASTQRAMADSDELIEIQNYATANKAGINEDMFGKYEGRNVIFVSMESLQSFVINQEMNGHVVTPFLNSLTQDKDTYYFSDFYHQTGLGKTSDSEFIVENGFLGSGNGAAFFTNGENTYTSLSQRLGENGYYTSVIHANNKSFWNRDRMYQSLSIDHFYDVDAFTIGEGQSVSWGMKDIPFFEQSAQILSEVEQPFATRLITLTNHHPFELEEQDKMIPEYDSNSGTVNRYFQTVRYMDESFKVFFEQLKATGVYDNSIIVMYGDHYGISELHHKAMAQYLGKEELTAYDHALLQSVPMFIHIPGSNDGQEIKTTSGQMDLRPTILHLLGISTASDVEFGNDMFSEEHPSFVPFRDGRVVTSDYVYTQDVCYDRATGEETIIDVCAPAMERAASVMHYSDQIISMDLLRFFEQNYETSHQKE